MLHAKRGTKELNPEGQGAAHSLLALQHCGFSPVLEDLESNWSWEQQV